MGVTRSSAAVRCHAGSLIALLLAGCGTVPAAPGPRTPTLSGPPVTTAAATTPPADPAPPTSTLRLPGRLPERTVDVPILMYHRIDRHVADEPAVTRGLTVTPSEFAAQMRWVDDAGYRTVSLRALYDALMRGSRLPAHPIVITFDDGYADVVPAARVLHQLGMGAVVFLIADRISATKGFVTWRDVRTLEALGVEVGSHSVSHRDLRSLPDAVLARELVRSRALLEQRLGHPVQWFCYPAGRFDDRVVAATRKAGYVLAVTTVHGRTQDAQHPLRLVRIRVQDSTGPDGLADLLRD